MAFSETIFMNAQCSTRRAIGERLFSDANYCAAHLDTTTIVEGPCSLSLRGTSGERAGERGTFHRIGAANWNPLSLTLSPLLRRGERESTSGRVVVSRRCAHYCAGGWPTKFAASSVLPLPLYFATCG